MKGFDGMARYEDLPYRTCVGMMLINKDGLVFIGRRAGGIEHVDESHIWQMPQGGVDPGEDTWEAAKRELYEETNVRSVEKLGEVADWLIYDIPRTIAGRAWTGRLNGTISSGRFFIGSQRQLMNSALWLPPPGLETLISASFPVKRIANHFWR